MIYNKNEYYLKALDKNRETHSGDEGGVTRGKSTFC